MNRIERRLELNRGVNEIRKSQLASEPGLRVNPLPTIIDSSLNGLNRIKRRREARRLVETLKNSQVDYSDVTVSRQARTIVMTENSDSRKKTWEERIQRQRDRKERRSNFKGKTEKSFQEAAERRKRMSRCRLANDHPRAQCPTGEPWRCKSKQNYDPVKVQESRSKTSERTSVKIMEARSQKAKEQNVTTLPTRPATRAA